MKKVIISFMLISLLLTSDTIKIFAANVGASKEEIPFNILVKNTVGDSEVTEDAFLLKNEVVYVNQHWISKKLGLHTSENNNTLVERTDKANSQEIKDVIADYKKTFANAKSNREFTISKEKSELIFYFREGCKYAFAISKYLGEYIVDLGYGIFSDSEVWFPLTGILDLFDSYCYMKDDILVVGKPSITVVDLLHRTTFDDYYYDIVENYGEAEWIFNAKRIYASFYYRLKNYVQGVFTFDEKKFRKALTQDEVSEWFAQHLCTFNTMEAEKYTEGIAEISLLADLAGNTVDKYVDIAKKIAEGALQSSLQLNELLNQIIADPTGYHQSDVFFDIMSKAGEAVKKSSNAINVLSKINFTRWRVKESLVFLKMYTTYLNGIYELNGVSSNAVDAVGFFLDQYDSNMIYQNYNIGAEGIRDKLDFYKHSDSLFENEALMNSVLNSFASSAFSIAIYEDKELMRAYPQLFAKVFHVALATTIGWDMLEWFANRFKSFDHLRVAWQMNDVMQLEHLAEMIAHDYKNKMTINKYVDLDGYRKLEWVRLKSYYLARETMISYCDTYFFNVIDKQYEDKKEAYFDKTKEEEEELLKNMEVLITGYSMGRLPDDYIDSGSKAIETNAKIVPAFIDMVTHLYDRLPEPTTLSESDNSIAEESFIRFLEEEYLDDGGVEKGIKNNIPFAMCDINNDGTKELIIEDLQTGYFYRLYRYDLSLKKVVFVGNTSDNQAYRGLFLSSLNMIVSYHGGSGIHIDYCYYYDGTSLEFKYSLSQYGKRTLGLEYHYPDGSEMTITKDEYDSPKADTAREMYDSYTGKLSEIYFDIFE